MFVRATIQTLNQARLNLIVADAYHNARDNDHGIDSWSVHDLALDMMAYDCRVEDQPIDRIMEAIEAVRAEIEAINAKAFDHAHC